MEKAAHSARVEAMPLKNFMGESCRGVVQIQKIRLAGHATGAKEMIVPKDGGRHKSAAIINGAQSTTPIADNPAPRPRRSGRCVWPVGFQRRKAS